MPTIIQVEEHSPRDAEILALRHRVLRAPLGLAFTPAQLAMDVGNIRFAALQNDMVIGSILIAPQPGGLVKFRQMAVEASHHGLGIGQQLLHHAEQWATANGYTHVQLHARETAIPFYTKYGYAITSEPFTEVTIPHRAMAKHLS